MAEDDGNAPPPDAARPAKGHWRKGRSRNLDPSRIAQARTLCDLLDRAIRTGWRHPTLGMLSLRIVGAQLSIDHTTVGKWTRGERMPPLWALDELRLLLREYQP